AGGGEGVDQAGDRRVGGDRAEDGRLTPEPRDVREAVPAEGDRQGDVQEDLAGVVDGPRPPPRSQSCGYGLVQADLADCFDEPCWSEVPSAFLTACRTAPFMKARG